MAKVSAPDHSIFSGVDHFALLNEPRRPWLDPESLKQKFLTLSASVHPDRVHRLGDAERAAAQERYVQFNAAYQALREPRDRLRHLLELELGALPKEIQRIPSGLMDLSLEIGQACRHADTVLAEKAKVTSPLLKVQCVERGHEETGKLQALQQKISGHREQLDAELRRLDADWNAGSPQAGRVALLNRIEELYRLFSYFARWNDQLQERIARLSF